MYCLIALEARSRAQGVKVLAGPCALEGTNRTSSGPSFWQFLVCGGTTPVFTWRFPVHVALCPNFPLFEDTSHIELGPSF